MRRPAQPIKPRTAKPASFPAPVKGWIANANLAKKVPEGAFVLDNFFPTETGVSIRAGSTKHGTIGAPETTEALSGTVAIDETVDVVGTSTAFLTELEVGEIVEIDGEQYTVATIADDENLTLTEATHDTLSGETISLVTVQVPAAVTALMTYINGNNEKMFGATAAAIFDVTTESDPAVIDTPVVTGQSGGAWIDQQFATSGGVFLIAVNGTDPLQLYNGTVWYPVFGTALVSIPYTTLTGDFTEGLVVTGGTSGAFGTIVKIIPSSGTAGTLWLRAVTGIFQAETITDTSTGSASCTGAQTALSAAITGIDTDDFSYVWNYSNRLFFIEKESLSAWYLPAGAIAGAATELPLGGVFSLGGSLVFGSAWSIDDSSGLASYCAFFSSEGEVAVYGGTDPASPSTWSLVGVYRMGRPLGPRAHMRAGGDIVVATDIGAVSLAQATQKDVAAQSGTAVSYPIETAWAGYVANRTGNWNCLVWPTGRAVIIAPSKTDTQNAEIMVANARTGAWCRFTGWPIACMKVFRDKLYFGTADGFIVRGGNGGYDLGMNFQASCLYHFDDMKSPASIKIVNMARAVFRAPYPVNETLFINSDFDAEIPSVSSAVIPPAALGDVWGTGLWGPGGAVWGEESDEAIVKNTYQEWRPAWTEGYTIGPGVALMSGSTQALNIDLVRIDALVEEGDVFS